MKIKICGLKNLKDIEYINEAKPDFAGFIFAPESKRRITVENAINMKNALNKDIKSVGVFVNENPNGIIKIASKGIIDIVQLHGSEDNDYIINIKQKTNLPVIKAIKADKNIEEEIKASKADYILIDSCNNTSFGGTGNTFDWRIIPQTDKKIFLAGGLNCDNIKMAIREVNPYCLDINSGVETNGAKDREKILEIIKIIKGNINE